MILLDALRLMHNGPNSDLEIVIYQEDCKTVSTKLKDLTFEEVKDLFDCNVLETVFDTVNERIKITIDWGDCI